MDELKSDLVKANYYSVQKDGSNDKVIVKKEVTYILFLHHGVPKLRYLSFENVKFAVIEGILQSLNSIVGLNGDGASANIGRKNGLGLLIKQNVPWLELAHCFNHRLELALKDAFDNSSFGKNDTMLTKPYSLYQKIPKIYGQLKQLSEAYNKSISKPLKVESTCWIDYK